MLPVKTSPGQFTGTYVPVILVDVTKVPVKLKGQGDAGDSTVRAILG